MVSVNGRWLWNRTKVEAAPFLGGRRRDPARAAMRMAARVKGWSAVVVVGRSVRGDWFVGCRLAACATIQSKS